jgi:hypothetical protein
MSMVTCDMSFSVDGSARSAAPITHLRYRVVR